MSARDLAHRTKRHVTTIQSAMRGKDVSLKIIGEMAKALGVPPAEIISIADQPAEPVRRSA